MANAEGISRRGLLLAGAAAAAGLSGCTAAGTSSPGAGGSVTNGSSVPAAAPPTPALPRPTATGAATTEAPSTPAKIVDPASVKANELGLVPVMVYHRITPTVHGQYDTTPADFKGQLQQMFAAGYRPARTIDLVRGDLRVAAGYTPVVLTFDDGYPDQFAMSDTGEIDPATAVGIMLDVCKQFPDCPPAGSFNINKNPFGLSDPAAQHAGLAKLHPTRLRDRQPHLQPRQPGQVGCYRCAA